MQPTAVVHRGNGHRVAIARPGIDPFSQRRGVAVDDPVFNVWVFRGEQVVGLHFYADRESALRAAGLRA